jgi:hypothetical protein
MLHKYNTEIRKTVTDSHFVHIYTTLYQYICIPIYDIFCEVFVKQIFEKALIFTNRVFKVRHGEGFKLCRHVACRRGERGGEEGEESGKRRGGERS